MPHVQAPCSLGTPLPVTKRTCWLKSSICSCASRVSASMSGAEYSFSFAIALRGKLALLTSLVNHKWVPHGVFE